MTDEEERARTGGVELARQALAAARAQARRQGRGALPGWGAGTRRGAEGPDAYAAGRSRRAGPIDEVRSGPRPDDRDPQPLGRSMDRLVADRGWELDAAVGALLGRWPAVVGADVAAHAEPEGLVDGVLTIRASSTAWAVQLRELVPALRARIDSELGAGVCRRIAVVGPAAPSWRRGRLAVRGRGPRDTYG